jgi:hypothetical protein
MAVRAPLIFRGLIGQFFSIFINMMTFIALLNFRRVIMIIMSKNGRRSPLFLKAVAVNHHHIFLGECR